MTVAMMHRRQVARGNRRKRLQRWIGAGFRPAECAVGIIRTVVPPLAARLEAGLSGTARRARIAVLLPTIVSRIGSDRTRRLLDDLPRQIDAMNMRRAGRTVHVFVALQWFNHSEEDALLQLQRIVNTLSRRLADIPVRRPGWRGGRRRPSCRSAIERSTGPTPV